MHFLTFTLFPLKKKSREKNGQKRCRKKKNDGEFEEKKSGWKTYGWRFCLILKKKQNAESCFDYFSEKSIFGDGGATSYGC